MKMDKLRMRLGASALVGLIAATAGSAHPSAAIPPPPRPQVVSDFDGDGRSDLALWDPSTGYWRFASTCEIHPDTGCGFSHGHLTDTSTSAMLALGDFDGDGVNDPGVFDRDTGLWHIVPLDGPSKHEQFGVPGDIAVPADYDGDGITDLAVFRPDDATWHIAQSSAGPLVAQLGKPQDRPVPADYDGDGRADLAVFRPADGAWIVRNSSGGTLTVDLQKNSLGVPVPADYDGDGRADFALYLPSTGQWLISRGGFQLPQIIQWGSPGDLPVPADYDGDGIAQIAVYRPATTSALEAAQWGWLVYGTASPIRFGGSTTEQPVNPLLATDAAP